MAKRRCFSDHSPRVLNRDYDRVNIDEALESLFAVSDSTLIDASFDGLVELRSTGSDQSKIIQRALHLGFLLLEAGKRAIRIRPSFHNASVWPLPSDLTVKVFSMLETPSVCFAAATCSFFRDCAIDPLCYANINMVTSVPKVNDAVVSTMIQQVGNDLQSIKIGVLPPDGKKLYDEEDPSLLTSSCLSSLSATGGAPRPYLRRLHLYHIRNMDNTTLSASLSVCPSLVDLEIVNLENWCDDRNVDELEVSLTLESVSRYCCLLERFVYKSGRGVDELKTSACEEFVLNCPKITTLALNSCCVNDSDIHLLVKGFPELKYVDFSESDCFSGSFTKNLGTKGGGKNLEVMILRECLDLDQVKKFMKYLLAGNFRLLQHLDISNSDGLAYNDDYLHRRYDASFIPIKKLLKQRPSFCLVAEYPNKSGYNSAEDSEKRNSTAYEESSEE